ncbi:MAG TPA: hypothetical protein VK530_09145, partial [Candidatus Acidoferrum sp.]|nr:hypothetical protein [Candidatus Acidoferrum sp.]
MKPALLCFAGMLAAFSTPAATTTRFEEFTKKFAHAPDRAEVIESTYLGSAGTEWLTAGGFQPDGTIVVAGVSLGPDLDLGVKASVLGNDGPIQAPTRRARRSRSGRPELDQSGRPKMDALGWTHPNATAFIARLSPDLKTIKSVTRVGWKSGGLTGTAVDAEGNIYVCGPAANGIASISSDVQTFAVSNAATRLGEQCAAVYLAKISPDTTKAIWVRLITGPSSAPKLSIDKSGRIHLQAQDLRVFDANGKQISMTAFPSGEGHVAVSPVDGSIARGSEHHWPTGREPYRNPTLNIHKPDGALRYELYNWDGPLVGLNDLRLVSDSAIRGATYDHDGNLLIHGWSDGANSVLLREPTDAFTPAKNMTGLGFNADGAGVLICAYVIKIDAKDYRVAAGTLWVGYLHDRDKPNSVTINAMGLAPDGSVCLAGNSAWGLIQTGNAFPSDPSGNYVAVMSSDLRSLRFSSTMPATGQTELNDGARWGVASG